jgi:hypothetical protein
MNCTTINAKKVFEEAKPLSAEDLQGSYRGKVLSLPGFGHVPDKVYRLILALVNNPMINFVWKGKYFNAGKGANLWFFCQPRFIFAHYDFHERQGSVELNYDVQRNPRPARKFSAVLRQSSDNKNLIGEAFVSGKHALFFTLEKVNNCEL